MSDISRHDIYIATVSIVAGTAQLQTRPMKSKSGPVLEVALNDGRGGWDGETGVTSGSIGLDADGVRALAEACGQWLAEHA